MLMQLVVAGRRGLYRLLLLCSASLAYQLVSKQCSILHGWLGAYFSTACSAASVVSRQLGLCRTSPASGRLLRLTVLLLHSAAAA